MKKKSLLIIAAIFLYGGFLLNGQVLQSDSLALVDFYNSTNGPQWKAVGHNWLTGNVSTWAGIGVTGNRVTSINLDGLNALVGAGDTVNNFDGTLNASLEDLTELNTLMINGNENAKIYIDIHGAIPAEIWNLTKLVKLQFKYTRLTEWTNRNDIYKLSSLEEFNTQATQFGGSLPDSLFTIPTIKKLYLHSCNYTGDVPATLTKATNLTRLYLWGGSKLTNLPYVDIKNKGAAKLELDDNYFTFAEIKAYADSSAKYADFSKNTRQFKQDTVDVSGFEGAEFKFSEKIPDGTYYKWYKDTILAGNLVSSDSTYVIATLSPVNQGLYICEVEDTAVKNVNSSATVTPFRILSLYQLAVNPPPAPTLVSAETDGTGAQIILTFSKAMNNPAAFASDFTIKVNSGNASIKKLSLDATDSKVFVIDLNSAVAMGDVILLSYEGTDVTAEDNGVLASITDQAVTNNVIKSAVDNTTITAAAIYPNPFTDDIKITSSSELKSVRIMNITGKTVVQLNNLSGTTLSIPVQALKAGIYIISVESAESVSVQKITKR